MSRKSVSEPSASELSYLKAQMWTLENQLKEEKKSNHNLTNSFIEVVNEKYELLEELTNQKQLCVQLHEELQSEREKTMMLMDEVGGLQEEVNKNQDILENVVAQNVDLKESIVLANETIHQIGLMYLEMKEKIIE